jgi:methionyl-tRNA formyltransferase
MRKAIYNRLIMTHTSKTLTFFGSGPVAAKSLEFLAAHFDIEAVVTKEVPAHHKEPAPVEELAKILGLPLSFASTGEALDALIKNHAFHSQLGIVIDYGVIMSELVIQSFPLGIINSHFSLLPKWRGADPITFSILSGQPKTGVSLMLIEPTLDTGRLIAQKSLTIDSNETTPSLTDRLISLSNSMLKEYIPGYVAGEIKARKQPHPDRATYSRKLTKTDGIIDWHKPAIIIEREIRAYKGWPQSRTTLGSVEAIITQSHVISTGSDMPGMMTISPDSTLLTVSTTEGTLSVDMIKPAGKKEMPIEAFLRGYTSQLNY